MEQYDRKGLETPGDQAGCKDKQRLRRNDVLGELENVRRSEVPWMLVKVSWGQGGQQVIGRCRGAADPMCSLLHPEGHEEWLARSRASLCGFKWMRLGQEDFSGVKAK